ncbi:cytochrome P450 [Streptomyces sp. NPDC005571]|uniref:cytochrome P450 n=1 Tax=Streptomyces sp. NPDC005571 TaxID=3156888 RepID=UPI0033BA0D6F
MTLPLSPTDGVDQTPHIDLVDPQLYATGDPHAVWRWLRRNDPVYWHEPSRGMPGFWALTKYHDIVSVLGNPEVYSSAEGILLRPANHGRDPGGGRTLALTDPPRHRQLRSVIKSWFSERAVRQLKPGIREIAQTLLEDAAERGTVEFVNDVAARLPLYVICRLMGIPDSDREYLFGITSRAFCSEDPDERRSSHVKLMEYLLDLADEKRRAPGDDIISDLSVAEVDGHRLTESELLLNCDNVFIGGTENVRIAASAGIHQFLQEPAQWQALRADPGLLPGAVEEVLRWTTTPTHLLRTTRTAVTIGGRTIGEGERVTLWMPSANRDEDVFAAPDTFDIRRTPNRHIALGTGEHFCIGGILARAELQILYGELAALFDVIEPAGEPVLLSSIVVNGPSALPVRLVRTAQR